MASVFSMGLLTSGAMSRTGVWFPIMQVMSVMAVVVNCLLL
jgi:hypothetical protein